MENSNNSLRKNQEMFKENSINFSNENNNFRQRQILIVFFGRWKELDVSKN